MDTETVDGKLAYAGVREVWTGVSGVVTWAPEQGATVKWGGTLLKVAGRPVTLMYGGGRVEIRGRGIAEGVKVGVPAG